MKTNEETPKPAPGALSRLLRGALTRASTYAVMGLVILLLDLLTGPFFLFPILFVIPVTLSAWFCSARQAYLHALLLPVGRLLIAQFVEMPSPFVYIAANALTRMAVLVFIAFLVSRTARQTRELKQRVDELVTVCAWSRTVEYQGEWISFEEYLQRRFNISTSHGISPIEAQKVFRQTPPAERKPEL